MLDPGVAMKRGQLPLAAALAPEVPPMHCFPPLMTWARSLDDILVWVVETVVALNYTAFLRNEEE